MLQQSTGYVNFTLSHLLGQVQNLTYILQTSLHINHPFLQIIYLTFLTFSNNEIYLIFSIKEKGTKKEQIILIIIQYQYQIYYLNQHLILFIKIGPSMSCTNEKDLIYEETIILQNNLEAFPPKPNQESASQYFKLINIQEQLERNSIHQTSAQNGKLKLMTQNISQLQLADYLWKHHQIYYDPSSHKKIMQIAFQYQTANYEAIRLNVEYGSFNFNINVINIDQNSNSECLDLISAGSFGKVYKAYLNQQKVALKRTDIHENRFQQALKRAIKEYFFLKIASALKIGPKLLKIYGFDIAIFRDSIQFSMEYCKFNHSERQHLEADLKSSLRLLHSLRIVHRDIKPQNLAYSPFFQRYVFLDVGLSQTIKQKIGEQILTSFVGTVHYCCKQMKELFKNQKSAFIDLYYNDAYSLNQSIIEILQWNSVEYVSAFETQQFQNLNNLQKKEQYYENQKLIFLKGMMYDHSVGRFQKQFQTANFQQTIFKFLQKFFEFQAVLPAKINLRSFYQKYFKQIFIDYKSIFNPNRRVFKLPFGTFEDDYEFFAQRYIFIKSLNKFQFQQFESERICPVDNLCNDKIILNYDRNTYILNVIRYIKINGQTNKFEDKAKVCKFYAKHYLISQIQSLKLYKIIIIDIFYYALNFQDEQKVNIFKHSIQTVVMLQLIPQQKVIQIFIAILASSLSFIKKMTLIFEFVIAIEFTKEKYKTQYNFKDLTLVFMRQLNNFLDTIIKEKRIVQIEMNIFSRLKEITNQKLSINVNMMNKQSLFSPIEWKQENNRINQGKVLLQTIKTYMMYYETTIKFKNQCHKFRTSMDHLITQVDKLQINTSQFSYLYFLYYQYAYFTHQNNLNYAIYNYFQLQFRHLEEAQHFKIYFINKVIRFNGKLTQFDCKMKKSKQTKLKQFQKYIAINKNQIQGIFSILQYIINHNHEYHFFLQLVFFVNPLNQKNPTFKSYSIELIRKNKVKLVSLTDVFHKNSPCHHNYNLKSQITVTRNIISLLQQFELAGSKQIAHQEHFIKECYKKIQKSSCFTCKVSCNIEVKLIEAQLFIKEQKYEQFIDLISQLFAIHFKYTQFNGQIARMVIALVREWWKNEQIYRKYHVIEFIYRYASDFKDICICFWEFDIIFVELYVHLLEYYEKQEILEFLSNILNFIKFKRKMTYRVIDIFYYNLLYVFKIGTKVQQMRQLKLDHNIIANQMLSDKRFMNNPYVSLYFSALLQIRVRGVLDKIMLNFILQSLSCVDNYSKNIILSNLFAQFVFYEQHSIRKLRFLNNKHIKHSISMFTLTFILKVKLKPNKRKVKNSKFVKKLATYIEKYYKHKIYSKNQCQQSQEGFIKSK